MKEYARLIDTQTLDNGRIVLPKSWVEKMLRRFLPYKEIGWVDIGEVFFRYQIAKTPWFNIYLHQLDAPQRHPVGCHDHPWRFITFLLKGGYLEYDGKALKRRYAGQVLYRPADYHHDVTTPYGAFVVIDYHGAEESELGILEVRTMRDSTMKGILHAAMSALAIVEAAESKHAARRALNGLSAVYHALCVVYHFRYEVDENQDLTNRVPRARIQPL